MNVPVSDPTPTVSVVVPLWNEEENISRLMTKLTALPKTDGVKWEFIFVDDGSSDGTHPQLTTAASVLPSWKLLQLTRNFGQQSAYRAGLDAATGDAVVFLDADLQDPPELIPKMVELWRAGAKLVIGQRRSRGESGIRRLLFDTFHSLFHWMTSGAMPKDSGTFGLMDRAITRQLQQMPELNLFLPALRCWVGYRREIILYDREVREGAPKQTLSKLFSYAWDGITSFSVLPLKAISLVGIVISIFGFGYAAVLVAIKLSQFAGFFRELVVPGFTTLAVAVFCLGGIQLVCLGILGEYLAKVYKEVKRRPIYVVAGITTSDDVR
jgi:dolichol-phosphate mannosyltransferase